MNLTISEKDSIYDFLSKNKKKFIYKKDTNKMIDCMNNLILDYGISFNSLDECFDYLTEHWDKKCKNDSCCNNRKLTSIFPNREDYTNVKTSYGIYKFCENSSCNYKSISERQMGDNNTCHRMSDESFRSMCEKNSLIMKNKIRNGEFIPNITNSWARSRCELKFNRDGEEVIVRTRSSWDAYFQLYNKSFLYEKVVIPYKHDGIEKNYIVDFVDIENKILYEIKPKSAINNSINKSKFKYAKKWCLKNGYKYQIIKDDWFRKNYDENIVYGQPSEYKILKNLKQFS